MFMERGKHWALPMTIKLGSDPEKPASIRRLSLVGLYARGTRLPPSTVALGNSLCRPLRLF